MEDKLVNNLIENLIKIKENQLNSNKITEEKCLKDLEDLDVENIFKDYIDEILKDTFKIYKNNMYQIAMEQRIETDEFIARNEQKWGKGFVASETLYVMVIEAAELYGDYLSKLNNPEDEKLKADKQYTYLTLKYIHGRVCQQYLEVLHLIKAGFADGAYARWRSIYELSIIANFIKKYGEKVAKAFFESQNTEDRYNWAKSADCFSNTSKKYINFNDIQNKCEFINNQWREQYKIANQVIHGSSQGTFNRLGMKNDSDIIAAGHSDYGIALPAMQAAISLNIITSQFLSIFSYSQVMIHIKTINKWVDLIRKYYTDIEKNIFQDNI
ncbi:hypothetical protein GOQ27_13000 [Clostridium sp. D2Q-11]|uniref:Uncharacterized protein n=1 Tax=Anaeromonas frigoriresistens TaxID=2683708 RepID=A0A942V3R8_9FIRM|nr:DUF5677 domain-containing protein [Anaeromonas frigoriresistens]MBS4539387.1 hypothetical protein [Anaeromonas frigoriresistens]